MISNSVGTGLEALNFSGDSGCAPLEFACLTLLPSIQHSRTKFASSLCGQIKHKQPFSAHKKIPLRDFSIGLSIWFFDDFWWNLQIDGGKVVLCFVEFADARCAATALEALQGLF